MADHANGHGTNRSGAVADDSAKLNRARQDRVVDPADLSLRASCSLVRETTKCQLETHDLTAPANLDLHRVSGNAPADFF